MSAPPGYESNTITITVGDDFGEIRPIEDVPNGQALAQATWTVKPLENFYDTGDALVLWKKTVTTADTVNVGQIEDAGGLTGEGRVRWEGTASESLLGVPGREYIYDMEVVSTAGKRRTYERGMVVFYGQVTQV
jgi:hypothetical protein